MDDKPRLKLIEIIAQSGRGVIDEPQKLEGLLMDSCGESRREVHALMYAVSERIPHDLCAVSGSTPLVLLKANLVRRLMDKRPIVEDMADWAVETWAIVLGVVPLPSSPNPTQAPPVLIESPRVAAAPPVVRLLTPVEWLFIVTIVVVILVVIFMAIFALTRTAVVDVKMVLIPAGPFQMGSNQGNSYEKPAHTVTVDAFLIDVYEVTNAEYAKCVADRRCAVPGNLSSSTRKDYYSNRQYANYPVVTVSWDNAKTYCEWRGARLPSEAEWEKAARGGLEGKLYPWGDSPPVCTVGAENGAQFEGCTISDTVAVGSFKPNGYGLYDMAGNAWEWVNDWWSSGYYSASPDHSPNGLTSGNRKVLRGGAWYGAVEALRVTSRYVSEPATRYNNIGFRCVAAPGN